MTKTTMSDSCDSSTNEHQLMKRKPKARARKPITYVTDKLRLKMLLLITEFGLSCYMAAKVLEMPYTNAKVIYRVFRLDKRIVQNSRNPTGYHEFGESQALLLETSLSTLREEGKQ